MTALTQSFTDMRQSVNSRINWRFFLQDNLTGSWFQMLYMGLLILITVSYTIRQLGNLPLWTTAIIVAWAVGLILVVVNELRSKHTALSRWLKHSLFSSVANTLLTLLLSVLLVSSVIGVIQWAFIEATFDPTKTTPEFQQDHEGATWGVVWGARKLLLTGLLSPDLSWRVWLSLGFIVVAWAVSYVVGRPALKKKTVPKILSRVTNVLWLLSPVILYIFLAGVPDTPYNVVGMLTGTAVLVGLYLLLNWQKVVQFNPMTLAATAVAWPLLYSLWWGIGQSGVFATINVDDWGGLLLTMIIASSVIILSLPLGIVLALGRRSEVYGIPSWILWPVAIGATLYFGLTSTPELWDTSRNTVEQVMSLWPVLILGAAYMVHNNFKGNIVAGASTTFIELIRSVPLITLLFMGIVMAPFFFETGTSIAKPWPIIVGYTLFSSAYMAETIRGGLQAISKGQYEAADALGLNGLQKMRFIIMPQALRIVIPPIVGQFIGAFKSSSLVSIVGLFDLLGIQKAILANTQWQGLRLELYVFLGLIYFIGSFVMSTYSRRLESRLEIGAG